jgi:hypothetical protein
MVCSSCKAGNTTKSCTCKSANKKCTSSCSCDGCENGKGSVSRSEGSRSHSRSEDQFFRDEANCLNLRVTALNLDAGAVPDSALKARTGLVPYAIEHGLRNQPTMLTYTEVQQTVGKKLTARTNGFFGDSQRLQYHTDYAVSLFNEDKWEPCVIDKSGYCVVSKKGKYMAHQLKSKNDQSEILYTSLHLPYKQEIKKQEAYRLLMRFIEEKKDNCDGVCVSGDFNASKDELWKNSVLADGYTFAFDSGIDNVVVSDSAVVTAKRRNGSTKFSHKPIFVKAKPRSR